MSVINTNIVSVAIVILIMVVFNIDQAHSLVDETSVSCQQLSGCPSRYHDNQNGEQPDRIIYFGLMLAYPDPLGRAELTAPFDDGHDIAPAAYAAVEQVNNRSDLLSNYTVELIRVDGGCSIIERTVVGFNELACSCEPIVGIVGPSCGLSAEKVSRMAGIRRFPMVSIHYGEEDMLGNRFEYPYAFGILGSSSMFADAFVELIKCNRWTKIAILRSEDNVDSKIVSSRIQEFLSNTEGFEIAYSMGVSNQYIPFTELKSYYVRIIIILASPETTLRALCIAHYEGMMYPNYQWIFRERISSDFHSTSFFYNGEFYSCSERDIASSLNGSINLALNALSEYVADDNTTYQDYMMHYHLQKKKYSERFGVKSVDTLWARGMYDAVWSMAFALNNSVQNLDIDLTQVKPGNILLAQSIQKNMFKVSFQGISGTISFDNKTGFNSESVINVYQYKGENNPILIGSYVHSNLTILLDRNPVFVDATFPEENVSVNGYILALFFIITIVSFFLAIPIHVISIVYRNHKAIKASSHRLNHLIFLGCYLMLIGTFVLILSYSVKSEQLSFICIVIPWILTPGTTLIIGTVCMRTWRLHRIYNASKRGHVFNPNRHMCISDPILATFVLFLITVDLVICLSWTVSDPLKVVPDRNIQIGDLIPIVKVHCNCESKYVVYWSVVIVAYKGILTLCSLILGLRTRINMKEFSTRNVIILVYILSVVIGFGIPLYMTLSIANVSSTVELTVLCVIFNVIVHVCLITLFYPVIIPLIKEKFSL